MIHQLFKVTDCHFSSTPNPQLKLRIFLKRLRWRIWNWLQREDHTDGTSCFPVSKSLWTSLLTLKLLQAAWLPHLWSSSSHHSARLAWQKRITLVRQHVLVHKPLQLPVWQQTLTTVGRAAHSASCRAAAPSAGTKDVIVMWNCPHIESIFCPFSFAAVRSVSICAH